MSNTKIIAFIGTVLVVTLMFLPPGIFFLVTGAGSISLGIWLTTDREVLSIVLIVIGAVMVLLGIWIIRRNRVNSADELF